MESLIEQHPTLYGQAKIHKPHTSLRPIIPCIGSATHKIACVIAEILIPPLHGTINHSHVKTFEDLLNKIKDINIQNKTMNNLDITSFYTNVPIKNTSTLLLLP